MPSCNEDINIHQLTENLTKLWQNPTLPLEYQIIFYRQTGVFIKSNNLIIGNLPTIDIYEQDVFPTEAKDPDVVYCNHFME